jgi:hypothetical protein
MEQIILTNSKDKLMNRKYLTLGLITFMIVLCVCCISFSQYLSNGCFWWECAPERNFRVLSWEVPADMLPEGAIIDHISTLSEGHGEIENGAQDIQTGSGIALYRIYRFSSAKGAIADFNRIKRGMTDPETGESWQTPPNVTFSSTTADDIYMACGYWVKRYRCDTVSRYKEYVLFFSADINEGMAFSDYERILFYLDEQISSRLYP